MPHLRARYLDGQPLVANAAPVGDVARRAFCRLTPTWALPGAPQSPPRVQAALLTGRNVPAEIGYHYGPKPQFGVAEYLRHPQNGNGNNLFQTLRDAGRPASLLTPIPGLFRSGRRAAGGSTRPFPWPSSARASPLKTTADLVAGPCVIRRFHWPGLARAAGIGDVPMLTHTRRAPAWPSWAPRMILRFSSTG